MAHFKELPLLKVTVRLNSETRTKYMKLGSANKMTFGTNAVSHIIF